MTVTLSGAEPAPTPAEIAAVERAIGVRLPADYVAFLRTGNECEPAHNVFDIGASNQSSVRRFHALRDLPGATDHVGEQTGGVAVPIAYDDFGNSICIGVAAHNAGTIHFLDHERPGDAALTCVAPSLSAFLDMLQPFDPSSVAIVDRDVVEVWIDPAFLAELKGKG